MPSETAVVAPAVATPAAAEPTPEADESISSFAKRYAETMATDDGADEALGPPGAAGSVASVDETAPEAKGKAAKSEPLDVSALQKLAKEGKYSDVLEALGAEVDGTKVPSDRFAKFRKFQKVEKAKIEARERQLAQHEAEINGQMARREAELKGHVERVLKDYEGFAKAKKSFDNGDVVEAFEAAFGEKIDDLTDKAIKQKLGQDPEVLKLKRRLELKEKAELEAQTKAHQEQQQLALKQRETQHIGMVKTALTEADDPTVAKMASYGTFADQVYRTMLATYQSEGIELEPEQAAKRLVKALRAEYDALTPYLVTDSTSSVETTDEPGTEAQNTNRAGKSLEKTRKPTGVPLTRARTAPSKSVDELPETDQWELLRSQFVRDSRLT